MAVGLAQAIGELEIPVDRDALAEVLWWQDRLAAKVSEAVGRVDQAELYDEVGMTSMRAWLKSEAGFTNAAAHRSTVDARKLAGLPVTAAAWRDGTLSGGHVAAILGVVKERYVSTFADHEAELVPALSACTVRDTEHAMQYWRAQIDAREDGPEPKEKRRELHLSSILDGRGVLSGCFDADLHELIRAALDAAEQPDTPAERAGGIGRSAPHRRADALGTICRFFLDHQPAATGASATRHVPHVNVIVDVDDLVAGRPGAHYANGAPASREWLEALLCDSWVRSVFVNGRTRLLDYGTETRICPSDLWHALVTRDEHCRFPGCDRPASWSAAHHVVWHSHGGATRPDNMVLLCVKHHSVIHKEGWSAKMEPDGTLWVTTPSGGVLTSEPARRTVPRTGRLRL